MSRKSTISNYGTVAVSLHWLSALIIIALLGSGFLAGQSADLAAKADILRFHAPMGIAVLFLTLGRIVWWRFFDTKPAPLGNSPHWQEMTAKIVHVLLMVVVLGMAASGIGMMVLSGAGLILFGGAEGALPDFQQFLPRTPHGLGARALVGLLAVHVAAALYHHFVKRDVTLKRMWFAQDS